MAKKYFGTKVGTCPVCSINLWDTTNGKPAIWPCGVVARSIKEGKSGDCPYETAEDRKALTQQEFSAVGSGLLAIIEQG